ncbi:MAG: hypothetical protein AAF770_03920 [Bacteroidota bacterium]
MNYHPLQNGWFGSGFEKPKLNEDVWAASWHSGYLIKQEILEGEDYLSYYNYAIKWNKRDTFKFYINIENLTSSLIDRKIQVAVEGGSRKVRHDKGKLNYETTKLVIEKGVAYSILKFTYNIKEGCWTFFISPNFGLIKQYGPGYSQSFEVSHSSNLDYGDKERGILIKAIKSDSLFHTRCDEGLLW